MLRRPTRASTSNTEEGYRDQIAKFTDTAAAKAVDTAVASVQARADKAAALVEKIRRDLSPNGDTAAEQRATRCWDRTKALLDSAKEPSSTAQKLIAKASREEWAPCCKSCPPIWKHMAACTIGLTPSWPRGIVKTCGSSVRSSSTNANEKRCTAQTMYTRRTGDLFGTGRSYC